MIPLIGIVRILDIIDVVMIWGKASCTIFAWTIPVALGRNLIFQISPVQQTVPVFIKSGQPGGIQKTPGVEAAEKFL